MAEGKVHSFITHKLDEIKAVADRCSVLRPGKIHRHRGRGFHCNKEEMSEMMVGRKVSLSVERLRRRQAGPLLEAGMFP